MSWLSELSHDQGKVALFAAADTGLVGLSASAVAAVLTAGAAGHRAIATMRLQWVHNLGKILAEYHSLLLTYEDGDYRQA